MAELMIKVRDNGKADLGRDKDILCAFNDRRIRCCHAQHICHVKNFGFNRDGLRPASLSQKFYERTSEFKMERVSRTEVRRTNLITLEEDLLSDKPNASGEYIHLPLYLNRRVRHPHHKIFGVKGSEIWYAGKKDYSNIKMNLVWNDIETDTPLREVSFDKWPLSMNEKRYHLNIAVDDFTDEVRSDLESAVLVSVPDGRPGREDVSVILHKHKYTMNYEELVGVNGILKGKDIDDLRNLNKEVDFRNPDKRIMRSRDVRVKQ